MVDYPDEIDVRLGLSYKSGAKTGSCAVPPPAAVGVGVPVDDTTGTAAITVTSMRDAVWSKLMDLPYTAEDLLKIMAAVMAGKTTIQNLGGGLATAKFRNLADTLDSVTADMAGSERTALAILPAPGTGDTDITNSDNSVTIAVPSGVIPAYELADIVLSNTDNSVAIPYPALKNITAPNIDFTDSTGVTSSVPSLKNIVATPQLGWQPDVSWRALWEAAEATVQDGDDGFVGLYMVYPNIVNPVTFQANFYGTGTVSFGDGSAVQSVTNSVTKEYVFNYDNIPSPYIPELGCKLAVVKFTSTGNLISLKYTNYHSAYTVPYSYWLSLKIASNVAVDLGCSIGSGGTKMQYLNCFTINNFVINSYGYALSFLINLKLVKWKGLPPYSMSGTRMFNGTPIDAFMESGVPIDIKYISNPYSIFSNIISTNGLIMNIAATNTTLSEIFSSTVIPKITLTNTGGVIALIRPIYDSSVMVFEMDNCANITAITDFIRTTTVGNQLKRLILTGLKIGIDISNGKMQNAAMDAFGARIGKATGAQTIKVTGNPISAGYNYSVFTSKGFTFLN